MNPIRDILILLVRLYQRLLSPLKMAIFGPQGACRFSPSCSDYAIEALRTHGVIKGAALAAWRILRCNPWGGCGEDPVPQKGAKILRGDETCGCKESCAEGAAVGGRN